MKIDCLYHTINVNGQSLYSKGEIRYFFLRKIPSWDGTENLNPLAYSNKFNVISVLWSEEELSKFRPNDSVSNFKNYLNHIDLKEIKHLKNYKKSSYCFKQDKKRINEKIIEIEQYPIIFVKVIFE
jgi:hypothetical protein